MALQNTHVEEDINTSPPSMHNHSGHLDEAEPNEADLTTESHEEGYRPSDAKIFAGEPDAGKPDAAQPDAGEPDAAESDAGEVDEHTNDPSPEATSNNINIIEEEPRLWLTLNSHGLERIYDYNDGGHCPSELGSTLCQGRYRIIHKLGHGGFGIVWLCRDLHHESPHYVAIKVLVAALSREYCGELEAVQLLKILPEVERGKKHLCVSMDSFQQESPNGTHHCFVYPFIGPRAVDALACLGNSSAAMRKASLDTIEAVACLHKHGICHGDLTAKNILVDLRDLGDLPEADLLEKLGQPEINPVKTSSTETPASAPQYLVYPVDFSKVDPRFISDRIRLIDFGEAFEIKSPPDSIGLPVVYQPPELVLDGHVGVGCDLWALGNCLYELRTGQKLIDVFDANDTDDYLFYMVMLLGKLPEPWWSSTWKARKEHYTDEVDADANNRPFQAGDPAHHRIGDTSIKSQLENALFWNPESRSLDFSKRETPPEELEAFIDLLEKLLRYKPEDRLSAEEALQHPWFRM
ncbi:kinase-like protein [Pseudovirgaria hyperparasitica]|uniref:EKC/KEOPS complex subunit BUD32 n=1 Tax=Pseudovirgaria hyperparasitica TaxID=470096 RepID=A0A6A6W0R3_9PEZI|nr:kinase-like protein [Pseudovirgaria hyperparasitica]KAF2755574.1 kinase-like protein [Pseudovirgaria hyperparasitica]